MAKQLVRGISLEFEFEWVKDGVEVNLEGDGRKNSQNVNCSKSD